MVVTTDKKTLQELLAEFDEQYGKYAGGELPVSVENKGELLLFLQACFSINRMLVIKSDGTTRESVIGEVRDFAESRKFDFALIDAKVLTPDSVRGEKEIVFMDGRPYYNRKKPFYWPQGKRKVILIDGITQDTDIEVLRALLYVACLGGYDRDDLPDDKLPDGSGFVFLADSDFPLAKFASTTDYWHDEARIFEAQEGNLKL